MARYTSVSSLPGRSVYGTDKVLIQTSGGTGTATIDDILSLAGEGGGAVGGGYALDISLFGADGDGSDATAAINAACAASGPLASELYIPDGDYLLSDTILLPDTIKKVKCSPGARIIQTVDKPIFRKAGTIVSPTWLTVAASGYPAGARLMSLNDASTLAVDDFILIRCNDLTPNVTAGSRVTFLRRLLTISTNVIYFDAATYRAMTTGMSVRKVALGGKVIFEGGTYTASDMTHTNWLFDFVLCYGPDFNQVTIKDHGGPAIRLGYCMGGSFNESHIYNLTDDLANGQAGYGVMLAGATRGFKFNSGTVGKVRHAITTGTFIEDFVGTNDGAGIPSADWHSYLDARGEPEACYYGPVYCYNTTNAAFDLHEQGYGFTITPNAHGCFEGLHIRASNVTVNGGQLIGCRRNAMRVSAPASNAAATVDYKLAIKGLTIRGVALDGAGGTESAGINVVVSGAELDISDVTVVGYKQYGIWAQAGSRIIVRGGTFDGLAPDGQTAIQLESSNNIIRGALIRNNAIGLRQEASLTNNERLNVIYAGNTANESIA